MHLSKKLISLSIISTLSLLSGCGDGSTNVAYPLPASKVLTNIQQFTNSNLGLVQDAQYQFAYANGRLSRINVFDAIGSDNVWGTSDDNLYSYTTCDFSGQLSQPVRDPALEFYIRNPMQSSVSGSIVSANLGIKDYSQSLCSLGYRADSSFMEKEFISKISDNNQPFFIREWQASQSQGQITKTESITYGPVSKQTILDNEDCSNITCDQTFLGFQNGRNQYQYLGKNYLADIKNKKLYEYVQQNGQLKTVNIYNYPDTPEIAVTNLNRQIKTGSIEYTYQSNQTRICHKNSEGIASALYVNTYQNGQITQAEAYANGVDQLACTPDDVVIKRTVYQYS